ncbi:hypothetical protein EJ04DRAFT_262862 [Polyplosphaeria fusca]|uniref:Amidohydrolase-related domain-containing protein n=1 Tax=Polyplosphaeria fusca TaxID=682080 RepID=A0A9P4R6W1_9PLEO|nr:hypothetical protein EJ04DRAFT_262862 [Polyplosphaeria fusca]
MSVSGAPFIAAEEYYLSNDLSTNATGPRDAALNLIPNHTISKLRNTGPSRIRDMRSAGVSMQILSHIPIDATAKTCQKMNDMLYTSVVTNQDRFTALALLPIGDAKEAASELQRCVTKYRFVGGVLGFRRDGPMLDSSEWDAIWTVVEKYKVPIALRPLFPSLDQLSEYAGSAPQSVLYSLTTAFHTFHITSPMLILRLYAAGIFDRHPNLHILISQLGHSIPELVPRIESCVASWPDSTKPRRSFLEVWQTNFYVSLADMQDLASLKPLLEHIPVDRILYAGNYPWEEKSKALMAELKDSELLAKEEWEKVAWKNAERLFGLKSAGGDKGRAFGRISGAYTP